MHFYTQCSLVFFGTFCRCSCWVLLGTVFMIKRKDLGNWCIAKWSISNIFLCAPSACSCWNDAYTQCISFWWGTFLHILCPSSPFSFLPSLQIFVCGCGALCSLFPHSSFCAQVHANEECVSEIKNPLAHSVSRPAILDQPCCFLHIIETSLRLFNLYIWMTYRWACVFITMVTAWGERERVEKKWSKRI